MGSTHVYGWWITPRGRLIEVTSCNHAITAHPAGSIHATNAHHALVLDLEAPLTDAQRRTVHRLLKERSDDCVDPGIEAHAPDDWCYEMSPSVARQMAALNRVAQRFTSVH